MRIQLLTYETRGQNHATAPSTTNVYTVPIQCFIKKRKYNKAVVLVVAHKYIDIYIYKNIYVHLCIYSYVYISGLIKKKLHKKKRWLSGVFPRTLHIFLVLGDFKR